MEIIIFVAVVVVAALLWGGYVKTKKTESDRTIDNWQPPKAEDKSWPFPGGKVGEGTMHEAVADVATVVESAPVLTVDGHGDVQEVIAAKKTAAKKAPAKKAADPKPAAKKASAKKSST